MHFIWWNGRKDTRRIIFPIWQNFFRVEKETEVNEVVRNFSRNFMFLTNNPNVASKLILRDIAFCFANLSFSKIIQKRGSIPILSPFSPLPVRSIWTVCWAKINMTLLPKHFSDHADGCCTIIIIIIWEWSAWPLLGPLIKLSIMQGYLLLRLGHLTTFHQ